MKDAQPEEKSEITRLNKLKDKLLDLSSRSRKIRFSISKWLSCDLTELINKNNQNLTSEFFYSILNLITNNEKNKENISLDLEEILKKISFEDALQFQKKIICLQKKNLSIYQEKGYKSLFLGVIFLRGYFYNSKNVLRLVNAPLFLLPCDLEKVKNLSLVFKSERKINHSLLYYLQKELGLAKDKLTDFLNTLEKNKEKIDKWENYLLFLYEELQKLFSTSQIKIELSKTAFSFLEEAGWMASEKSPQEKIKANIETIPEPFVEKELPIIKNYAESFVKLTLTNKTNNYQDNHLEIVLNFCLTIDSEPNLSLFHDFEEIIEEYSQDRVINWSKSALNLLRGEVDDVLPYSEKNETKHQPNSLYTPFPSDPSQTRILQVIFQNFSENTLCIDGPPGTGKSQLICNLLANSLFYQKKVLVICEKEVALKVIYDKLSFLGFNHSIVKINELAQTPQIYREILSKIENEREENTNLDISEDITRKIIKLEEKLAANFKKIEKYCEIEKDFKLNYQTSLQEVYIKFERKTQLTPTIVQLNIWVRNQEQLDKLKIQIKNYIGKFGKIFSKWEKICLQLKNLFLENNSQEFEFNLENQNNFQEVIRDILKELKGEKPKVNLISQILRINLLQKYSESHHSPEIIKNKLNNLQKLQIKKQYQQFFSFLGIESFNDFWQKCSDKKFLLDVQQFISEEFLNIGELFVNPNEEVKKNINYFLEKIFIHQEFSYLDDYEEITEQAVYFNWIKEIEEKNKETLTNWSYEDLANIQQEQKEITKKKTSLVKTILKIKQKQNLEELSTNLKLRKELSKKRKISSLKTTFPELVNYFPIWLSTPEVISSITNLQEPIFDFLVFDEASQMPLEKTIPLWARAKKCIIIGDEQQLPPTDFFKSHLEDNDEIWEEEEEKILNKSEEKINLETDDLEKNSNLLSYAKKYARNREKLTLLYHYRSKYPELIEFSNQAFYNGILQIVSASEIKKKDYLPIEYHYQDKGRWINNENQIEAHYIVDLLKTLPENKEVGIITFNSTQRDFLAELIGEEDKNNNLFIKSLEEVQGDERDIIIFSIGYAPNKEEKIFLNFGPLNKEGGEKRLNVAISRAREKLIIVTSLLPSDLKRITEEDENRKLGPKLFKKYLEYAHYSSQKQQEKIQNILESSLPKIINSSLYKKSAELEEFSSFFEEEVYNELVKQNYAYEIHKQVKSIGYHINLAIWDNQIKQYILGIECDGKYWHDKLEIEKDIYRQQILEDKGWKMIRILSRDWSRNKEREIERIKKALEQSSKY